LPLEPDPWLPWQVFDAYRSRSSAGSLLGTKKHPIQKLEEFFLNLNPDLLLQRSRLVAEHNLHFATLAWVNNPSKRLHLASMHILCELCAFHDREKWSEEVCKSIVELGGVRPILDHLAPDASELAQRYAATILSALAESSEECSRLITKSEAPRNLVKVLVNIQTEVSSLPCVLPACVRLIEPMAALSPLPCAPFAG